MIAYGLSITCTGTFFFIINCFMILIEGISISQVNEFHNISTYTFKSF